MDNYSHRRSEYLELIKCIPLDTADFVFAYGSGAISQSNENIHDKMVDFIVITNNPLKFHTDNINQNPNHYSFLRRFGPKYVTKFQTNCGASVYYNTRIESQKRLIKYGIISTNDAIQDLLDWKWLYVSGRMQKPVLNVLQPTKNLAEAIKINRVSALQFALIMLGDTFTYEDLFKHIVGISYNGDFRQKFGEDKNKIDKIVKGSYDKLVEIYKPLLEEDYRVTILPNKIEQDNTTQAIFHRINLLPLGIVDNAHELWKKKYKDRRDIDDTLFSIANRIDVDVIISRIAHDIVAKSSKVQTLKNSLSAGFTKSLLYSSSKILKMIRSIR